MSNETMPQGEIVLQPPPALPRGSGQSPVQLLVMLPMMLGMGAMSFVYIGRSNTSMTWIFGALFASAMIGMIFMSVSRGGAAKKAQINDERRDYLRYLGGLRKQVREVALRQRAALLAVLPDPAGLWTLAGTELMWERRRGDADFGRVRIGIGPQRLATPLRPPQTAPLEDLDPLASTSLRHFIRTYATVPDLPVAASLRAFARIGIAGERPAALGLARSLLAQLATFHSPEDLRIACCLHPDRAADWEWVKWLPHALHRDRADAAGPLRLCATDLASLAELLAEDLDKSHLVVVVDTGGTTPDPALTPSGGRRGVTVLDIDAGPLGLDSPSLDLVIEGDRLGMRTGGGVRLVGRADRLDAVDAEVVARQLASFHVAAPAREQSPLTGTFGLPDLLGIGDPRTIDPAVTWRQRSPKQRLRLPIGVGSDGRPLELDLKESAEGGMGPHGLVIGATGSGKSELLRTLVTGLAVTHSSETLNFALIDFKGGATFAGMGSLPHTCAVITNLSAELALVDRMGDALRGELVRRQELLRAAGNFASVRDYERAREAGAKLSPLPSLLVIIDEFSELLSSRPEFIDLFVMIGRLGRSLGIHLMLASQRLEEGRLRGLDSHLSYRIGLRTFSAPESRAVLGVPDAYELPPEPGNAYLKIDTSTLLRFKAAFVSGDLPPAVPVGAALPAPVHGRAVPFTLAEVGGAGGGPSGANPVGVQHALSGSAVGESIMGTMLGRLEGHGPAPHPIWLPPLSEPATLDQILPPLAVTEERGLCPENWAGNGRLTIPLAIVDKPFEQRRDLLWADLSGAAGHAVVVGAPQSGKSTMLRTFVAALALTHTPEEVQFFLLDFGGGTLSTMASLPHVSGCATRLDAERCRRTVAEVTTLLTEREQLFASNGIDSMASFRAKAPQTGDRRFGDVFLVVDGWMTLRQEYDQLEEAIATLAARGLGFGIHVVLSANRWMEIKPAVRDMIGTQFELRLGDPSDSAIDRRAAANVPQGTPGRGLTADRLHYLTALPRMDGVMSASDVADGLIDLVKQVDAGWPGRRAPRVRLLPLEVPAADLPAATPGDRRIPIGVAESDLAPVLLDFDSDPHFILFGDVESGKTGVLRLIGRGITDRYPPEKAGVLVVDYRRSLLDTIPTEHLLGYAGSEPALGPMLADVARAMRSRLPGPDVTPQQLRNRSWWSGPELFLLVDDYDLVTSQNGNPLNVLLEFLPQARDIGLHLILGRRSGGAGRALYEPVLQRVRELGSPGLILSGSRDEGALLGDVKPGPQPPGRGNLISRRTGVSLIQAGWLPCG
jgi:S-DNA-T family DNA segregation ATPase FtsK/SpoIIIE